MEIYGDNLFSTGISYPHITEKIVIKDDSEEARKILKYWKFKADIEKQKIIFDDTPSEPTPEEKKKLIIAQSKDIIDKATTLTAIKTGLLKLFEIF